MNDIAIFGTTRTAVGKFGGAVIKDLLDSNILPQALFCRLGKSKEAAGRSSATHRTRRHA